MLPISLMDRVFLWFASLGPNRLQSQLRVLQTESFVPTARLVAHVKQRLEEEPALIRLRAVADLKTLTVQDVRLVATRCKQK